MRVLIHDFPGHAFARQLGRELARRGHQVRFVCFANIRAPRGHLERLADDPPGFDIAAIRLAGEFRKYHPIHRPLQDRAYGRRLAAAALDFRPEVILSGNGPLAPQAALLDVARRIGARFVFWLQDSYGVAAEKILSRKLPGLGRLIGQCFVARERRLLRRSDAIVAITEDFRTLTRRWGIADDKVVVIENWAPLDELPRRDRHNGWARAHGLADKLCILYAGTLGLKHNPGLLLALAERYRDRADVRVVLVSEGLGARWLARHRAERGLDNLLIFGFQPHDRMPEVMATGDVLLCLLEPEASVFSVPSKVLAYLCAGRSLLLAVPSENLAARTVAGCRGGLVVPPDDADQLIAAVDRLLGDAALRAELGANARRHAEATFDVRRIASRFEAVLAPDAAPSSAPLRRSGLL